MLEHFCSHEHIIQSHSLDDAFQYTSCMLTRCILLADTVAKSADGACRKRVHHPFILLHVREHSSHPSCVNHCPDVIDALRRNTPGHDGSKPINRFERADYGRKGFKRALPSVQKRVIAYSINMFAAKVSSTSMSEGNFEKFMHAMAKSLGDGKKGQDLHVSKLLPKTFKGVLTLLNDEGLMDGFIDNGALASRRCLW